MIPRLGAGRGQGLARHHRDHDEVDDPRRDDERQRHQRIDPGVERRESEEDHERRAGDRREDRKRPHAPGHLAAQAARDELLVRGLEDPLRRRREPGVAAAELELLARRTAREEPVEQHPPVSVGLRRVDQDRLEPRSAEYPALAFDDPDAACHRLLEHFGRDRLGRQTQQHGALERVDHARRRVLRDDRRPAGRIAQPPRAGDPGEDEGAERAPRAATACSHPHAEAKYEESKGDEGARLEADRDGHGLVRQHRSRTSRRPPRQPAGSRTCPSSPGSRRSRTAAPVRASAMSAGIVTRAVTRPNSWRHCVPLTSQ